MILKGAVIVGMCIGMFLVLVTTGDRRQRTQQRIEGMFVCLLSAAALLGLLLTEIRDTLAAMLEAW